MPTPGLNPTVRRRELGAILRKLREGKGWTIGQVADRLEISSSKVSRLETGSRGVSGGDIRALCDLYDVDDDQRERLIGLAREGKQRAWWQPLGLPYSTYIGLEAEATSICDYGLGIVPGLLQTDDYARVVEQATVANLHPDVVEQRVAGRLARQRLLRAEDGPRFEAIIDESALHRVVGGPRVMRGQLLRLLELAGRERVAIRVIPFDAGALPFGTTKFVILTFKSSVVSDVVFIEGLTGDAYLHDPNEVEVYKEAFRALGRRAASAAVTREIISAMIIRYEYQLG